MFISAMIPCPTCHTTMSISHLHCEQCSLNLQGHFMLPRLSRLSKSHQKLAESFLMAGGNFKLLAQRMDLSYPTLRRRVDEMIEALDALYKQDRQQADAILARIEKGEMTPQEGLRLIREMNNEE